MVWLEKDGEKGNGGLEGFIHTPDFILIDKNKQTRGICDGTIDNEITRVIYDIKTLINHTPL